MSDVQRGTGTLYVKIQLFIVQTLPSRIFSTMEIILTLIELKMAAERRLLSSKRSSDTVNMGAACELNFFTVK